MDQKINILFEFQTPHGLLPIGFNYDFLPIVLDHTKSTLSSMNNIESHIIRTFSNSNNITDLSTDEHFSIYGTIIPEHYITKKLISDLTENEIKNDLNLIIIETTNSQTIIEYIFKYDLRNTISEYTKNLIRNNSNFKFILIDNKEGSFYYDDSFFNIFKNLYDDLNIFNDKQIFYLTNSVNVKSDYISYLGKKQIKSFMTVNDINFFMTAAGETVTEYFEKTNNECKDIYVEHNYHISIPTTKELNIKRNKYFLNFNRNSGRLHRPKLVLELIKNDLFDKGSVSLLQSDVFDNFANKTDDQDYKELIYDKYPFVVDHKDPEYVSHVNQYLTKSDIWLNSYFSIVSETSVANDSCFITEKTLKPVIYLHPFIVWGNPYTLKKLRELGFETFPELFDESYDEILNTPERLLKIIENVKRLCNLSLEELHTLYQSIIPKLMSNRKRLIELSKDNYEYKEFIKTITSHQTKNEHTSII